ncbi:unnamed protein product, partial [Symbiodinium sp. KB8]
QQLKEMVWNAAASLEDWREAVSQDRYMLPPPETPPAEWEESIKNNKKCAEKLSDQYGVAMGYLFPGDWFGYDEVIAAFTKVQGNRGRRMSLTLEPDERHYTTIARYAT